MPNTSTSRLAGHGYPNRRGDQSRHDGGFWPCHCNSGGIESNVNCSGQVILVPAIGGTMALRTATIYVLVAALLGCPFPCLAQAAAGLSASAKSSFGCDCCSRSARSPAKQCPGKSDSHQGSGTCLCHGAVADRHVVPADPGHEVVTFVSLPTSMLIRVPSLAERGLLTQWAACHFPAVDSGRQLRALIASLLC